MKVNKLITELDDFCRSNDFNFSVTYQKINDYSIEIYTGYGGTYQKKFYSDGHLTMKKALKKAIKFIKKQ